MHITKDSHVFLNEGEEFIQEEQCDDNILRVATYALANGNQVLVHRHFSQIGPVIRNHDGRRVETHVVNGKVVPF